MDDQEIINKYINKLSCGIESCLQAGKLILPSCVVGALNDLKMKDVCSISRGTKSDSVTPVELEGVHCS